MSFRRDLETWTANQVAVRALSDQAKAIRRLLRGNDGNDGGVLGPIDSQGLPGELREVYPPGEEITSIPSACRPFGFAYNSGNTFVSIDGTREDPLDTLLSGNRDWLSLDGSVHISWDGGSNSRYSISPQIIPANYFLYCNGDYIKDRNGIPIEAPGLIAGAAYSKVHKLLYVTTHEDKGAAGQSLLVYKAPASIAECTIVADGPFELLEDVYWIATNAQHCKGPTFFNGSATKFAFTTMADNYWNRDLWEGEIIQDSVTLQLSVDLRLKFEHTDLTPMTKTEDQVVVTYDVWCVDSNNQSTQYTMHQTVNSTVVWTPSGPPSDGRYYYCCDYKGDDLVYAALEQGPYNYSNGPGYSSITDYDEITDSGTGSAVSNGFRRYPRDIKVRLVFYGTNIPDYQCSGEVENTGGESSTSTYTASTQDCNDVFTRIIDQIDDGAIMVLDLRADILCAYMYHIRIQPKADGSGLEIFDYYDAFTSTPLGNESLRILTGAPSDYAATPCVGRIDYFVGAPPPGDCFYRDYTETEPWEYTLAYNEDDTQGPQGGFTDWNTDAASHHVSKSAITNVKIPGIFEFTEIVLSGAGKPVTENMDGVKAVGTASE